MKRSDPNSLRKYKQLEKLEARKKSPFLVHSVKPEHRERFLKTLDRDIALAIRNLGR